MTNDDRAVLLLQQLTTAESLMQQISDIDEKGQAIERAIEHGDDREANAALSMAGLNNLVGANSPVFSFMTLLEKIEDNLDELQTDNIDPTVVVDIQDKVTSIETFVDSLSV